MTQTKNPTTDLEPARQLLRWYDENRRDLPWRREPSPYHVWLSEIMLQQTRVEAVRGYYARFLERLPDIPSLAQAEEDVYLKLWEGLGYYSRVRNLHRAAVQITEERGGRIPRTAKELLSLPGIGPYTAAAIASICFGERIPAIDGNLLRIFARMTGFDQDIKSSAAKKEAAAYFDGLFPDDRPGDVNQALMDLGATVCLPRGTPLCGNCPWRSRCAAHRNGTEEQFPFTGSKKPRTIEEKTVFLIYYDQQLVLRKRSETGLLAGLYEFPNTPGTLSRAKATTYLRDLGFDALRMQALPPARHIF
ncbi:MAG: A/G-specific adenine glycosylase, partial [Bacillota bacterium]|nr:A/G-specific adenine glycosylase [Bacillota bacterium]